MSESIGSKLKTLRKAKKLTQEDLAGLIGVKRATISNYEINRRQPSLSELKRFAEFFGVGLDFFGVAPSDEVFDLETRARRVFSDPDIPRERKEALYKEIMRLCILTRVFPLGKR